MSKSNTIFFVACAKNWTKSISEKVEINPVILTFTIFQGGMPPDPSR